MTPRDAAGSPARTASRCGGRSLRCRTRSAPAPIRRAAGCRPRANCRALRRQPPHRPPRAGGTVARRPGPRRAGARQLRRRGRVDYAVGPRTRFSEWIRRHNKEPSGRMLRPAEMRRRFAGRGRRWASAPAPGCAAGAAGPCRWAAGRRRQPPFSAARFPRPARGAARRPDDHRGAARVGVSDYSGRSRASPPGCPTPRRRSCCAPRATGRCW